MVLLTKLAMALALVVTLLPAGGTAVAAEPVRVLKPGPRRSGHDCRAS